MTQVADTLLRCSTGSHILCHKLNAELTLGSVEKQVGQASSLSSANRQAGSLSCAPNATAFFEQSLRNIKRLFPKNQKTIFLVPSQRVDIHREFGCHRLNISVSSRISFSIAQGTVQDMQFFADALRQVAESRVCPGPPIHRPG
ncbi:MAG TPA: hypothetical protein PLY87_02570 [Planctomycetaceae bacterium]|nr:hypothetical protein [Planctomycetaceae bacterium]